MLQVFIEHSTTFLSYLFYPSQLFLEHVVAIKLICVYFQTTKIFSLNTKYLVFVLHSSEYIYIYIEKQLQIPVLFLFTVYSVFRFVVCTLM